MCTRNWMPCSVLAWGVVFYIISCHLDFLALLESLLKDSSCWTMFGISIQKPAISYWGFGEPFSLLANLLDSVKGFSSRSHFFDNCNAPYKWLWKTCWVQDTQPNFLDSDDTVKDSSSQTCLLIDCSAPSELLQETSSGCFCWEWALWAMHLADLMALILSSWSLHLNRKGLGWYAHQCIQCRRCCLCFF